MSAPTGVRGLLAKFENNNVSNISTSPPSRGRSPAGSDHSSAARPLSKVRASFVAVERNIPGSSGSPLLGLKRVGEAGDYFGAPRSVADEMGSPIDRNTTRTPVDSTSPRKWGTPQQQNSLDGVVSPRKTSDSIVSNVEPDKTAVGGKSKSGLGVILKGSPFEDSSAPPSPAKGQQSKQTAKNKDDKPNGKPKAVTPAASGTPTSTTAKSSSQRPVNNNTEKSTGHARTHGSMLAPAASSTAKPNASPSRPSSRNSTSASTAKAQALSRKPSTLRPSAPRTTGTSKPSVPSATTTTVRKQGSRASLAPQHTSSHDRPTSRASILSSRPVDDSSLARLIRPTASSANKRQEKLDITSPPRLAKAPRKPADKAPHTGSPVRTKSTRLSVRPAGDEHARETAPTEVASSKPAEPVSAEEEKPVEPKAPPATVSTATQPEDQPKEAQPEPVSQEVAQPQPVEVQEETQPEPTQPETQPEPQPQQEEVKPVEVAIPEPLPEEVKPEEAKAEETPAKEAEPVEAQPVIASAVEV
ncbi:gamma-aminobutyric acid A receptor [Microsporum canis CBS 113480]|uniref:Gamma-aminobutyric acid A receptor n=1 Tax=Arthroderma otae (strain ATCC MYA-4605 / CBS 113480) TaxID=554155 RepID=C5FFW6_ARTOC|nr:gamma-aminobutyric acid A receptor [Microsporum canis CBS 113480]EEQ29651.1 gamma-aminobutyric acid A receptor [Microsporum canis CBS 113480]